MSYFWLFGSSLAITKKIWVRKIFYHFAPRKNLSGEFLYHLLPSYLLFTPNSDVIPISMSNSMPVLRCILCIFCSRLNQNAQASGTMHPCMSGHDVPKFSFNALRFYYSLVKTSAVGTWSWRNFLLRNSVSEFLHNPYVLSINFQRLYDFYLEKRSIRNYVVAIQNFFKNVTYVAEVDFEINISV